MELFFSLLVQSYTKGEQFFWSWEVFNWGHFSNPYYYYLQMYTSKPKSSSQQTYIPLPNWLQSNTYLVFFLHLNRKFKFYLYLLFVFIQFNISNCPNSWVITTTVLLTIWAYIFDLKFVNLQYNTLVRCYAGTKKLIDHVSDVASIIFFSLFPIDLGHSQFFYHKKIKKKLKKKIEKDFTRNCEKKILGTSDAWSMRQSSHQPSDPGYVIEDCWISNQSKQTKYRF